MEGWGSGFAMAHFSKKLDPACSTILYIMQGYTKIFPQNKVLLLFPYICYAVYIVVEYCKPIEV